MLSEPQIPVCSIPHMGSSLIRLGHGSGGKMTTQLIESIFLPRLGNDILNQLDDAADVIVGGKSLAITTDSYVVSPIFFPGGDIGCLAVHGTVNDLAMRAARPLFLTATFILEEGLQIEKLAKIVDSVARACADANVKLVAADTKVVGKGAADKLFITTSGVGIIEREPAPAANRARPGDYVLLSGDVGRHGMAVMSTREGLELETDIVSDTAPLHEIVSNMLASGDSIHCLRDVTRGGLAGVLCELAQASGVGISIEESSIPVHPQVSAVCELLGLDPLYVACEGRFITIASPYGAGELLEIMRKDSLAENASIIGRVVDEHPGRVVLRTRVGGNRILDKLSGEQLPRIC